MKTKSESNIILILEGLKQFMELFSGPFLITYFIKLSTDSAITISYYQIISCMAIAVGSLLVGIIIRNRFKLEMYRLSIFMNLIYIVLFIVLRDRVLDYIPLVASLYGLSAACYWYPINLFKSTKINDEERPVFFAKDRIIVTAVSVLGPVILGTMITELSYVQTAYVISGISLIQLIVSFFLRPVLPDNKPSFKLREAIVYCLNDRKFRKIMKSHFCFGLNINGGALTSLAMIAMMKILKTDQQVGFTTSTANIMIILGVTFFSIRYKNKDPKYFIYFCGIVPVVIYLLQIFFESGYLAVAFYIAYYAFACMLMPVHDVYLYSVLARGDIGKKYREEFFSFSELALGAGRVVSFLLVLLAGLADNDVFMYMITLLLVLSLFYNSWSLNHFERE